MTRLLSIFAICLCQLVLFAQAGRAETSTTIYRVMGGDTHTAGETVSIGDNVATLTFGVAGDSDFNSSVWDYSVDGYEAFLEGNGINGTSEGGTLYIIRPNYNGYVNVAVVLNANKKFYILEDDKALNGYDGLTVNEQVRGQYGFYVKAGSTYKVYAEGTKLGFYGFEIFYSTDPGVTPVVCSLNVTSNMKRNVDYSPYGTTLQAAGTSISMYTYSYSSSSKFKYWTANGEIVSDKRQFIYTMPEKDVNMVAVYEFNPDNPGNPASAENSYKLTLESKPANAGYFNLPTVSKIAAGDSTLIYCYQNQNSYVFKEWQIDGNRVSTQREFKFKMPERNVTLTAVYVFKPQNPGNPGSNLFDAESGELILDDFTPNNAYNAAYNATKGEWDKISSMTIIGEVGSWDIPDVMTNASKCEVLDFSRTTGMNYIQTWAFENKSALTTVSLPASITSIRSNAFAGCTSLATLNVHATIPPVLSETAFGSGDMSIAGQIVVFVPASSLSLYESADVWKDLTIMPFTSEVRDLEINMPNGADMSAYKDMYLEALNTKSGQRLRYLITDKTTYTFGNVIKNTTWDVSVKNANDEVLGEIKGIEVNNESVSRTFESLKSPKNVTLKVVTPGDTDVTGQVAINWTDNKDNFLTSGATVKKLLEGNKVKYSISLSEALAVQYQKPEGSEYEVTGGDNDITVQLVPLPQQAISGKVTDKNQGSAALADAYIAVSQTINGQYSKTYATKTNAEGDWTLTVFTAPTEITASKKGYISQTLTQDAPAATIPTFDLEDINGTNITVALNYQTLDGEQMEYDDTNNVAYTITNETTGTTLTDFNVQYPNIVLKDKLADNTQLSVTITSKNQKFAPMMAGATVSLNKANVSFTIKEPGAIKASYTESENKSCVGILYDANGQLVKRYEYDVQKSLIIKELPDGTYTLVTMANSQFFNSIGQLSQLTESGLRNGVDYVKETIVVRSGVYTTTNVTRVPYFDESKLYYTTSNTSFTANKSQINAGQYLTLRGQVEFKDIYASQVSNVNLVVELTDNCEFVANSVMLGKNLVSYTLSGSQLVVPIGDSKEQVRFCVIPTKEGTFEPSASVSFTFNNKSILQPIGSSVTTVKGISITVPVKTAKKQFTASGTATAKSDVYVYVDDILAAKTTVKANGKWSTQCELIDPADKSEHPVYARVVTPDKVELLTDTKTVIYDEDAILAEKVGMTFFNGWMNSTQNVNWDMVEKTVDKSSYSFYTTTDFTFTISFTNNTKPESVQLVIYKTNNSYDIMNASYNSTKDIWVVSNRYSSAALPVAVKVKYLINGQQMTVTEDSDDEGIEHSNPILDPSGYVYEAVSSNRLQGVTAYIYYREYLEDQYGDKYEHVALWDAEEYAQQNPQFTDENGMYQWDVPNGEWQVRLEKEGYLKTNSEWLPVPPPQLDVNLPMTQMIQPNVKSAKAYNEGVEFEFDKYMNPATLTSENITLLKNGIVVVGQIELLNEEPAYEGATETFATKVLIHMPEGEELTSTDEIKLTISKNVESYAGVKMQDTYDQTFEVAPIVRGIRIAEDNLVNVIYGQTRTLRIAVDESAAAAGKTVNMQSMSELIATVNSESLVLDGNGEAEFIITGELPGSTAINFTVEGTDVEYQLTVNVKEAENLKTIEPRASRVSGAKLYRGEKIMLSCDTEDATIKYTLDGSSPTGSGDNVLIYNENEPIIITDDQLTIKAIATGKDMDPSEEVAFSYELKKSNINYVMPEGWSWISHNMEEPINVSEFQDIAERIVSQTDEVMKDPVYGFFGGLTELKPAIGYKIKVSKADSKNVKDNEFNARENAVNVRSGWNWIGYPLSEEMSVENALAYYEASEGDKIIGQDGSAEYADGAWHYGENFAMTPGKGYLFKTSSSTELLFNTNDNAAPAQSNQTNGTVSKRNWLIGSPWAYNKHAHPNIMAVTAELFIDGSRSNSTEYVIGAFNGDECVGVSQWNDGRLLMNVFGEKNENITFTAYNKNTEQYFNITENMQFQSGDQGSWSNPTAFNLGEAKATGIGIVSDNDMNILPIVARDHFIINAGGRYISRITLTSMNGTTVMNLTDVGTGATVTTNSLPNGVYIITVQAEGETFYRKIVKANQ